MNNGMSLDDERGAAKDVWSLMTTALGMPEGTDNPEDYWDDLSRGTCILLGITYKLARELRDHHATCDSTRPAITSRLIEAVLAHEAEVKKGWLSIIDV